MKRPDLYLCAVLLLETACSSPKELFQLEPANKFYYINDNNESHNILTLNKEGSYSITFSNDEFCDKSIVGEWSMNNQNLTNKKVEIILYINFSEPFDTITYYPNKKKFVSKREKKVFINSPDATKKLISMDRTLSEFERIFPCEKKTTLKALN